MKPIAVQLYTLREMTATDLPGVLKQLADIGYQGVEMAGLLGHRASDIRTWLDDLGLVACAAHTACPTKENLSEVVDTAKTLGYSYLVANSNPDQFKTLESTKAYAASLQSAAQMLRPHGLTMGYHNHWWEFIAANGQTFYDVMLCEAPDVIAEVDTYWASTFGTQDVCALVARYAARIPLLHLKDGPLVKDQPHTAAGAGKMKFAPIVAAADPNVLRWVVVELDRCATDMMTAVRESYRYLTSSQLAKGKR